MSGQFTSVMMFVSLLAIAFAANRASDSDSSSSPRAPASIIKELRLGAFKAEPGLIHTEKLRGPLKVSVEMVGAKPAQIGDVFVLRGHLTARETLDVVNFTWSLPAGVELVNGSLNGIVTAVSLEQPGVVEITLRKVAVENVKVHLQATAYKGGARFGDAGQYNPDAPEKSSVNASSETDTKIMH